MPNPLNGVRVKIDRAKKHLADLDTAINAFVSREPHTFIIDEETQPGHEIYRFCEREAIPSEWSAIVGDCVHNLRSALDLLANELVRNGGGNPSDYTTFPISPDETHFRTSAITRIDGASPAAIELVCGLNPYNGGNDALYSLHRIDIADKHQLLIPVAAANDTLGVRHEIVKADHPSGAHWITGWSGSRKFPLKDGDILISYKRATDPDIEDKTEFHFGFEIAFGEGQIFDGDAVIPTLTQLAEFTERLIDVFAKDIFKLNSW